VITYSFVDPELQAMVDPNVKPVPLANPISADMAVMRTNLWSGLLNTAVYNLNRQQPRVRIFEMGQCFVPSDKGDLGLSQSMMLAGLICGSRAPTGWTSSKDKVDFYDIKGDLDAVFAQTGLAHEFSYVGAEHPALHPGQTALISRNDRNIGWVGKLHPRIQKNLGLSTEAYLFQVDFSEIVEVRLPKFKEVSKFPEVKRDLAFLVEASVPAQSLVDSAREAAGEHLVDLKLFDVYQSKDVDNKGKSIALGLTFQNDSRTLTDQEINHAIDSVVQKLAETCGAELRA
jgi:phenylalanyl-tRNA synthetase beta chain